MGLEFIIIQQVTEKDKITQDIEINRFPCKWLRYETDVDTSTPNNAMKIDGEYVYNGNELIIFGECIIKEAIESFLGPNEPDIHYFSKEYVMSFVDDKETKDHKLMFISKLTSCSNEYFNNHYARFYLSRFALIAKVATCSSIFEFLSEKEVEEMEAEELISNHDRYDTNTMRRLVEFGLDLIAYGEKEYMGYWSC